MSGLEQRKVTPNTRVFKEIADSFPYQKDWARELDIAPGTANKLAHGAPVRFGTMQKVADKLGKSVSDLIVEVERSFTLLPGKIKEFKSLCLLGPGKNIGSSADWYSQEISFEEFTVGKDQVVYQASIAMEQIFSAKKFDLEAEYFEGNGLRIQKASNVEAPFGFTALVTKCFDNDTIGGTWLSQSFSGEFLTGKIILSANNDSNKRKLSARELSKLAQEIKLFSFTRSI